MPDPLLASIVSILKPGGTIAGTGFIVSSAGLAVTCAHVVRAASAAAGDQVRLVLHADGREVVAYVDPKFWRDPKADDIAILRLEGGLPSNIRPLSLGYSSRVKRHSIQSYGFPEKSEGIRADGYVLGLTTIGGVQVLQLSSAQITPGFSGAPVYDASLRRVIGMVTAIAPQDQYGRMAETAFITPSEALQAACPALRLSWSITTSERVVALIIFMMLIGSVATIIWLRLRPPPQMTGEYNIAVASFQVRGAPPNSRVGTEVAQDAYLSLVTSFELSHTIEIWGPDQVDRIMAVTGPDTASQAAAAENLAGTINAFMVVYGDIDITGTTWTVTPKFYVSTSISTEDAILAGDTTEGEQELGKAFLLRGQLGPANSQTVGDKMNARVQILRLIALGLDYDLLREYPDALSKFKDAIQMAGQSTDWNLKTLYLFSGNAALGESNQAEIARNLATIKRDQAKASNDVVMAKNYQAEAANDAAMIKNDLILAENFFTQSVGIDQRYARAYIGLGSVYYLRALEPFSVSQNRADIDGQELDMAVDTYNQALTANQQEQLPLADIDAKVASGLGHCYLIRTYSGPNFASAPAYAPAIEQFKAVIAAYGNGANPRVGELAAEAHARMGLIDRLTGQPAQGGKEYATAASLLDAEPTRQAEFQAQATALSAQAATATP